MANRLHTALCDMLGIEYPIVLAGMAVGRLQSTAPTPVELVATITNAGGLGVMGYGFNTPDEFDAGIKRLRSLVGDRPFGVDFLIPASLAEVGTLTNHQVRAQIERDYPRHIAFVKELIREHGLPEVDVQEEPATSMATIRRQAEVMLDNKVPVFACATGDPPSWIVEPAHAQGMKIIGMCGAVRHAYRHMKAGSDIITAQGTEAGGHTGNIATFVLVPQIVDAVQPRPVLAAGGIGSGRQVAAALALGAQGVWVGSAFLASEETNIPSAHQEQILASPSEMFTLGKFDSGLQARSYRSVVKEAWLNAGLQPLPMPLQGILMEPFVQAARQVDRQDLVSNSAGQVAGMLTKRRPAKEILMDLVNGAEETIERLQHSVK